MDWNEQFRLQSEEPFFWFRQSRRLKFAADLLADSFEKALALFKADPEGFTMLERKNERLTIEFDSFPVYVLLYGLSMENLAKGILVARNPGHFTGGANLTHGLLSYVEQCGLTLPERRRDLLKNVETTVVWKGRYPTPKKLKDWMLRPDRNGNNRMPGSIAPDDKAELESMYLELMATFNTENAQRSQT